MDSVMSKKREVVPSELLSKEFLSQFKTEADVSKFLKELHSQVLEQMLQGEMDSHLGYEKHSADGNNTGNSRNGLFPKKIQTEYGDSVIRIPRDRRSEFEPVVISQAPESRIVYREVGHLALRQRNERIGYRRRASRYLWDQPLVVGHFDHHEQGHPSRRRLAGHWRVFIWFVWMDGIVFKVRESGKVINKTVYLCIDLNQMGYKEVLGMWVGKTESSSFWMSVLTDLKARGVEDILIIVTDNLNGFTDTIRAVFQHPSKTGGVMNQFIAILKTESGFSNPLNPDPNYRLHKILDSPQLKFFHTNHVQREPMQNRRVFFSPFHDPGNSSFISSRIK